jgi:hypothetical protein
MTERSEDAIERVLAGLRDAETPAGMERRVLKALEERALVQAPLGWRRFRPYWLMTPMRSVAIRYVACGVAFAGVVAVGLVVHSISAVRRSGHGAAALQIGTGPLTPATAEVAVRAAHPALREPRGAGVEAMVRLKKEGGANARSGEVGSDADSADLRKIFAVSYPAPPMPLTEQERLLLRIAHRGNPVELAALELMPRPVQDGEEKRERQRFVDQFPKQPTAEQRTLSATEPVAAQPSTPEQGATGQAPEH